MPWLSRWHRAGAKIAGSRTGAIRVAATGLLDGRPATTHRPLAGESQRRYPAVQVTADRIIVDNGDVITSGGRPRFPSKTRPAGLAVAPTGRRDPDGAWCARQYGDVVGGD